MIPIEISARRRRQFITNIISVWDAATPDQELHGRSWYQSAHAPAVMLTAGNARLGAGVIAALSANKSWEENIRLARLACGTGLAVGHVTDALAKATAILAGTDPAEVLPMTRKTGHFFRCILDPDDPEAVVIDRHAHDVAVGRLYGNRDRGLSSIRRYQLLADCYHRAAARLGELPSTVQAVTCVVHTTRIAGTGTRRPQASTALLSAEHPASAVGVAA